MSDAPLADATGVSGRTPAGVHKPASLADLQGLVVRNDGRTLVPVGAATQLDIGLPPAGEFELVDLKAALDGAIEHQPDDLTAVVPAGVTIGTLQRALAEHSQWIPLDPPHAEEATIGGTLAAAAAGPLRGRYGAPRDLVLGMSLLRADGVVVKAGGRVVKNVTGYDLMRPWCGSFGTLGIITEVALRVYPKVETADAVMRIPDFTGISVVVERLVRADLRMQVADAFPETGGKGWALFLRLPRISLPALDRLAGSHVPEIDGADWYLRGRDLGFAEDSTLTLRLTAMPSQVASSVHALQSLSPTDLVARPAVGFVRATWSRREVPSPDRIRTTIARLRADIAPAGGSLIVERMPEPLRVVVDPWGSPPPSFELMKRLKASYDPDGRFAKGRFVGGI